MKKMDDNGGVALVKRGSFVKMTSLNSFARVVQVRIEFMSLGEVDTMNEKYQAEIRIKSRWQDEEEIDEYDKTKHWNPKLFIENALDNVREEITYSVTRSDGKSTITETRISKGGFLIHTIHYLQRVVLPYLIMHLCSLAQWLLKARFGKGKRFFLF